MERKKEIITGIVFARACCAIGIIINHYFCYSNGTFKFFYTSANANWGFLFVTAFFAISGAVLYYNYPKIISFKDLKIFYYKRWKSIYPYFYLCWILFFVECVIIKHQFLWGGNPLRLLLTVLGLDGYFLYKIPNYYRVGEWFLGAIIMLYFFYPFMVWVISKNKFIIPLCLCFGYFLLLKANIFEVQTYRNMITCTASFYFGMLAGKYKELFFKNKVFGIVSFCLLLFLCSVKLPSIFLLQQIQGFFLFIFLVHFGNLIMTFNLKFVIEETDRLSFCIFLFQHMVILHVLRIYNPAISYKIISTLLVVIIITIVAAKLLYVATNFLTSIIVLFRK